MPPYVCFGRYDQGRPELARGGNEQRCKGNAGGPEVCSWSMGGLFTTICCHLSNVTRGSSCSLARLLGASRGAGAGPPVLACSARSLSSATLLLAAAGLVVARRWRTKLRIAVWSAEVRLRPSRPRPSSMGASPRSADSASSFVILGLRGSSSSSSFRSGLGVPGSRSS